MTDDRLKIVVKVGNQSSILIDYKKTLAYRAITSNELKYIVNSNSDLNAIVIENITEDEYNDTKEIIEDFISKGKKVYFCVCDNDDNTCGLADELGLDIYMTAQDMYRAIEIENKVYIGTDIFEHMENGSITESSNNETESLSDEDIFGCIEDEDIFGNSFDEEELESDDEEDSLFEDIGTEDSDESTIKDSPVDGVVGNIDEVLDTIDNVEELEDEDGSLFEDVDGDSDTMENETTKEEDTNELSIDSDVENESQLDDNMENQEGSLFSETEDEDEDNLFEELETEEDGEDNLFEDLGKEGEDANNAFEYANNAFEYANNAFEEEDSNIEDEDNSDNNVESNEEGSLEEKETEEVPNSESADSGVENEDNTEDSNNVEEDEESLFEELESEESDIEEKDNNLVKEIDKEENKESLLDKVIDTVGKVVEEKKEIEESIVEGTERVISDAVENVANVVGKTVDGATSIANKVIDVVSNTPVKENTGEVELENKLKEALDRIESLNDLIVAIEDEKDTYKNMLKSISEIKDVEEYNSDSLELMRKEYDTLNVTYNSLKESYDSLKDNYNNVVESDNVNKLEIEKLNTQLEKFKQDIISANDSINTLDSSKKNLEVDIDKYKVLVGELESKLTAKESKLASSESINTELVNKIDGYKAKIEKLDTSLNNEISNRVKIADLLNKAIEKIKSLSDSLDEESNKLIEVNMRNDELEKSKAEIDVVLNKYKEEKQVYEDKIKELDTILDEYKETKIADEIKIEGLNKEIEELKLKTSSVDELIAKATLDSTEEISRLKVEIVELTGNLNVVNAKLESKNYQYKTLMELCGVDENGAKKLVEDKKLVEQVNQNLREQIVNLKNELDSSNKERLFAIQAKNKIEEHNKQLKNSLNVITSGITSGAGVTLPPCNYTGKGMIIPVFGCGSFGITTTAMTLANMLSIDSKVLYLDFDISTPKADGWFGINPIVKDIPDFNASNGNSTGLGLLMDRQLKFFLDYSNVIIKRPNRDRVKGGNNLGYLSGFYSRPDSIKLLSTDYTSFFNYCGNTFDYIIIDFGKLGYSEITDMLIKMVSDIAYKNVVVTTKDRFEVRNFSLKLNECKINKSNIEWLLNMCKDTSLDAHSKNAISPANYSIMPFEGSIFGNRIDFSKSKLTRDKFRVFMDNIFK